MKKIRSINDVRTLADNKNHILTLFSGGLDSSYILEVLKNSKAKVTALAIDLGDGIDESSLKIITNHFGIDLIVIDARKEFVEHSLVSAIHSQAYYLGDYPVSSSLSRPIIVNKAVELAKKLNCDAIIHTANQSQNSLRRLNGALETSDFEGYYGSPYEFSAITREEKTAVLAKSGLLSFQNRNVSGDSNLWCREFESGILDDPENFTMPESLYTWSSWNPDNHLPDDKVKITFHKGYPVSINDQAINFMDIINFLNIHAGSYEIGRYVGFDHLDGDEKVLEIREAPAASVLMNAYKLLETAILPTDVLKTKSIHNELWTQEAVEGRWGSMLQKTSYAFTSYTAEYISGSITFKLSRGQALANRIVAHTPMYLRDRDNWEVNITKERSINEISISKLDIVIDKVA